MPSFKTMTKLFLFGLLFTPIFLLAHGAEQHNVVKKQTDKSNRAQLSENEDRAEMYANINRQYIDQIKPVFEKKCFDCHVKPMKFPWYYSIPGIKQMIDYDIKKAKEHLDMSKDFPFLSHETPFKDLESLRETTLKGSMPPTRYILMHWETRLTDDEKKVIIKWSEKSMNILKEAKYE